MICSLVKNCLKEWVLFPLRPMILKFQASQRLKKLKLISSKNRTIKFFCSFFVRAVIHSLEFRCAFKQDQVDFLLEKLLLSLNSTVFRDALCAENEC